MTTDAWVKPHQLHMFNQFAGKPRPADHPESGWVEAKTTGLVHLLCNCGYSTGWIPRDEMPSPEQLKAEHGVSLMSLSV